MRSASHLFTRSLISQMTEVLLIMTHCLVPKAKIQIITAGGWRVLFGRREGVRLRSLSNKLQFFKLLVNLYVFQTKHLKHFNCRETLDIKVSYWSVGKLVHLGIHTGSLLPFRLLLPPLALIPTGLWYHELPSQVRKLWPQNLTHENTNELSIFPSCFSYSVFM